MYFDYLIVIIDILIPQFYKYCRSSGVRVVNLLTCRAEGPNDC